MPINTDNAKKVLRALRGNIPAAVKPFALAQVAHETAGFTDHKLVDYNNAGGITFSGSAGQLATGAYDSGISQPDGDLNYAAYPNLDAWAQDFARILYKDKNGIPARALSLNEYVQRLKDNGYFGDTVQNYSNGLQFYRDELRPMFPVEYIKDGAIRGALHIVETPANNPNYLVLAIIIIVAFVIILMSKRNEK